MFKSISFTNQIENTNNTYTLRYLLTDTDFMINLDLIIPVEIYENRELATIIPSGLITIYSKYKANIPLNIALFYLSQEFHHIATNKFVQIDKVWTDKHFPQLQYGTKYYNCTINQLEKLRFIKGN